MDFCGKADIGVKVKHLCRKHGFSVPSYYTWRSKYGGMDVSDAQKLKALEIENARLKKLLAQSVLENEVTKRGASKKMVTAPARHELVRWMRARGLTKRRSLAIAGMSASSPRYQRRAGCEQGATRADCVFGAAPSSLRG